MSYNQVFLGLGSNLGDKLQLLHSAKDEIVKKIGEIDLESSVYKSAPFGFESGNEFYNMVIRIQTSLNPEELLLKISEIELFLGRSTKSIDKKYTDRAIDIDILYFNKKLIATEKLIIPHPEIANRKFVLVPFTEIAGDFVDPKLKKKMHEILQNCPDESVIFNINSQNS